MRPLPDGIAQHPVSAGAAGRGFFLLEELIWKPLKKKCCILQHPKDDLPPVSLSVGVAFSDRKNPQGDIFRDADSALYRVKEAGRKGCAIYE